MKITTVQAQESGERIDALLAHSGYTRSAAARLIAAGQVTREGKSVKKSELTRAGDVFLVAEDDTPAPASAAAQDIPLDIVYEDADLIVVNKPRGLVVHPAPGHPDGTLVNALLHHCGDSLSGIGGEMRPGIVHRLDKDTSGLILIAKNDAAHAALSEQFKQRTMEKHYRAVAHGSFSKGEGLIDAPIGRHPIDRKKMAVVPNGKPSRTEWHVLEHLHGATYLDVHLLTGRTHQIRVHMLSIGHPLLGDKIYAPNLKTPVRIPRLMLHAYTLAFTHPTTGKRLTFCAPLPAAFEDTLQKFR